MIVYEDVYKAIEFIPTEEEKAAAALALLRYGCGGIDYNGDNFIIKVILQQARIGIDKAKTRYNQATENGKKGGKAKQFDDNEILKLKAEGMTNKQVAAALGCSEKTVQRANVANRQNGQNQHTDKTDIKEETDKTDTDRQNLNNNININNNSNSNTSTNTFDFTNGITEYGKKLKTEEQKESARYIIKTLRNRGFNDEFIYYAFKGLNGRDVTQYTALLLSKNYHEQIYNTINIEHKKQAEKEQKAAEMTAAILKQLDTPIKTIKINNSDSGKGKKEYIDLNSICDDE